MLIRTIKFDLPAIIFQVEDTDNLGQDLKEALDTYRREFSPYPLNFWSVINYFQHCKSK